jgi:dephospho-CoA kinase
MFTYAVALTGGIGTGKSTVSGYFKQDGWEVIDADKIAHKVLNDQLSTLVKLFGEKIVNSLGEVNREVLAQIVFTNQNKLHQLEAVMHPKIKENIIALALPIDEKKKPYIVDIPLFYEKESYAIEKVLVVYAPKTLQISRLMEQRGYSYEEAMQRIHAQLDIESKKQKATYLLDNSGTLEDLQKKYMTIKTEIEKDFK